MITIARGRRLQHFVNGVLMSEVIDEQSGKAAAPSWLSNSTPGHP
jgi:hypothetical protein